MKKLFSRVPSSLLVLALALPLLLAVACPHPEPLEIIIPVVGLELKPNELQGIHIGQTLTFTAIVTPQNATNPTVVWDSSNPSAATVSGGGQNGSIGTVRGVALGTTVITAKAGDANAYKEFTCTCYVTVGPPVDGVSLNKTTTTLPIGGTETLIATITPSNAANRNVTWSSSAPAIATVNNGLATGVTVGSATITVTTQDGGYSATCAVTVVTTGRPGTPIVNLSGLTASNNAITKHQYLISASDPSGLATSFTASTSNGGTLAAVSGTSGASGMWIYIPARAGSEIITVKGRNSYGESDGGGIMASVVENRLPSIGTGTTVATGATKTVTLPSSDADGDLVTWAVTNNDGLTGSKGSVVIQSSNLVIAIGTGSAVGDKYTLRLTSTEKYPNAAGYTVNTLAHEYQVEVAAVDHESWSQGDSRGQIVAYPNNNGRTPIGVPFVFQFNAGDPMLQGNNVVWWGVNGGLSPFDASGANAAPSYSWIGQSQKNGGYLRPAIFSLGLSFERWRLGKNYITGKLNNDRSNFTAGRLFFVPSDGYVPDTFSSRALFGVRANFERDKVLAYQDFYINVTSNQVPIVTGAALGSPLVFRSEQGTSTGEPTKISISNLSVADQDISAYGDVLTFVLNGVTYGNNAYSAIGGALDVTGHILRFLARPYPVEGLEIDAARTYAGTIYGNGVDNDFYEDGAGDKYTVAENIYQVHKDTYNNRGNLSYSVSSSGAVTLGAIEFVTVPKSSEIKRTPTDTIGVTNEGLTFHYTVVDLGGKEVKFTVFVPTSRG